MLYVCSTCGLAEELEQETKEKQKSNQPKSACGSVSITKTAVVITFFILPEQNPD